MSVNPVDSAEAAIDNALGDAFGNQNGTIDEKLESAGRKLPRGVSADVAYLHDVRKRIAHPRRRGQLDRAKIEAIKTNSVKTLEKVDISGDKARTRLNWLGGLVINLTIFAVAYYFLLVWLGAV